MTKRHFGRADREMRRLFGKLETDNLERIHDRIVQRKRPFLRQCVNGDSYWLRAVEGGWEVWPVDLNKSDELRLFEDFE